jgi:hypothetical protein
MTKNMKEVTAVMVLGNHNHEGNGALGNHD